MALINQNNLFDRLQEYIDKKTEGIIPSLQDLFDEYDIKNLVGNIDDIGIVAADINAVKTNASYIMKIVTTADNINDIIINADNINAINDVADNIQYIIDSYINSKIAEAEAMTADSYANEPEDVFVKDYYYDQSSDSILYNDIPNTYSSLHWSIKSALSASGLIYRDTWDSVDCSMPPDDTINGALYIISSIAGDTSTCPGLSVGDWLLWSEADDGGDDTWHIINWTFDWTSITNVPDNVVNAITQVELDAELATKINKSGDTMTGQLKGITPVDAEDLARKDYVDTKEPLLGLGTARQVLATNTTANGKEWIYIDNNGVPSGSIIMWSGASAPNGWVICDGNNGTPNLVDRFIKGSASDLSNVGSTGGNADAVVVSHNHTFTGDELPEHGHALGLATDVGSGSSNRPTSYNSSADYITSTVTAGTPAGTISSEGEDGTGKNEPQYYVLAYIMKL